MSRRTRSLSRLRTVLLLAIALAAPVALADEVAGPRQLTARDIERLGSGKKITSVTPGDVNRAEVVGVVNAPAADVWRVIADYDAYRNWFPDQESSRVISRSGDDVVLEGEVDMPFPLSDRNFKIRDHRMTRTVDGETHYYDAWTYVKDSGNIEDTTGYWYVMPFQHDPNRSVVRLVIKADFGVPLPDFILNWGTRRQLPRRPLAGPTGGSRSCDCAPGGSIPRARWQRCPPPCAKLPNWPPPAAARAECPESSLPSACSPPSPLRRALTARG